MEEFDKHMTYNTHAIKSANFPIHAEAEGTLVDWALYNNVVEMSL